MYLFVYIFLIMSIMGLYSQLFMLQAAAEKQLQVTAAQTMYTWHSSAYDLAHSLRILPAVDALCSLTPGDTVASCSYVLQNPSGAIPAGYPNYHFLPTGYNYNQKFRSFAYNINNTVYVVTFIEPTRMAVGFTASEIYTQMKRTTYPISQYGQVLDGTCEGWSGRVVMTNAIVKPETTGQTYRVCYPVPAQIPAGSSAYVSIF